jgi:hypothetical protein
MSSCACSAVVSAVGKSAGAGPRRVTLVKVTIYGKSVRTVRQITVWDASNPWPQPPLASWLL